MTKVAVIADIHSNAFALDAVIDDLGRVGVDEVWVAGDLVGRGPMGSAVVSRVRALGWPCIRGNHEDYLLSFIHRRVPVGWWDDAEWSCSRWMAAELGGDHVAFLDGLPMTGVSSQEAPLRLFHGSPVSYQDGLGPWTEEEKLLAFAAGMEEGVLVCAHTHQPMHRWAGGKQFVNVGSVGIPFNGDWRAQYGIFEQGRDGVWSVELRQVSYDREAFLRHYDASGFLREGGFTSRLLRQEIVHARPFLVPFLRWLDLTGRDHDEEHVPAFLEVYDPGAPLERLFAPNA
jgi:predicted phosphodiesterase